MFLGGCGAYTISSPAQRSLASPQIMASAVPPDNVDQSAKSIAILNFSFLGQRKGEGVELADRVANRLRAARYLPKVTREDVFVSNSNEALAVARSRGYDLGLLGSVDDWLFGGITTSSRAQMSLLIVDTRTGEVLWQLQGRTSEAPVPPTDYFFAVDRGSEAPPPMVLANVISDTMVDVILRRAKAKMNSDVPPLEVQESLPSRLFPKKGSEKPGDPPSSDTP
jgi:hypothetical protein